MARYFFDVNDGAGSADTDGVEFDDYVTARVEAVRFAGEMLCDRPEQFWRSGDWKVEVRDETGLILTTVVMLAINAAAAPRLGLGL